MMLIANQQELQKRREKAGYSMNALSVKAGLSVASVLRIEKGITKKVGFLRAREIAKALDCEVEDIFTPISKGA